MSPSSSQGDREGGGGDGPSPTRLALVRGIALVVTAAVAAGALLLGVRLGGEEQPADGSVEAGFLRDMQVHHAQAVEMSMIVRDRTDDPDVRRLAYDIALGQQQQVGQMYALLRSWDLSQVPLDGYMSWMPDGGESRGMDEMDMGGAGVDREVPMPGMATTAELDELRTSRGATAERQFLELMIRHHQAGVDMAQSALGVVENQQVGQLARSMQRGQQSEISLMRGLLGQRE